MVFIDADKLNYRNYYDFIIDSPLLRESGLILVDNVLWKGKTADEGSSDKRARSMRSFLDYVKQDSRVTQVVLPLRDGISLISKRK